VIWIHVSGWMMTFVHRHQLRTTPPMPVWIIDIMWSVWFSISLVVSNGKHLQLVGWLTQVKTSSEFFDTLQSCLVYSWWNCRLIGVYCQKLRLIWAVCRWCTLVVLIMLVLAVVIISIDDIVYCWLQLLQNLWTAECKASYRQRWQYCSSEVSIKPEADTWQA